MLGKIRKLFFWAVFTALNLSFLAQMVYVLGWISLEQGKFAFLALLSVEWLVIVSARLIYRRSSPVAAGRGNFGGRRH